MCNPAVIPIIIAAVGAAAKGAEAISGADADKQAADAQKRAALYQERDALERGAETAGDLRAKGTAVRGAQRAAMAANGVDLDSRGAQTVLDTTTLANERDISNARANALREAWGFASDAKMAEFQKKLAKRRSTLALLTGGVMAGSQGYQAYQTYGNTGGGGGPQITTYEPGPASGTGGAF